MAITANPYAWTLSYLVQGQLDLVGGQCMVALFKSVYVPDMDNDFEYTYLRNDQELDSQTGSYDSGGIRLTNVYVNYDPTTKAALVTADDITWPHLTGTFRYAVIYSNKGVDNPVIGLIDFGAEQVFNNGSCTLSFTNGVMKIQR